MLDIYAAFKFFLIINKDAINIFVHPVPALEELAVLEFGMKIPLLYFVAGEIMTVVFNENTDNKHHFH